MAETQLYQGPLLPGGAGAKERGGRRWLPVSEGGEGGRERKDYLTVNSVCYREGGGRKGGRERESCAFCKGREIVVGGGGCSTAQSKEGDVLGRAACC